MEQSRLEEYVRRAHERVLAYGVTRESFELLAKVVHDETLKAERARILHAIPDNSGVLARKIRNVVMGGDGKTEAATAGARPAARGAARVPPDPAQITGPGRFDAGAHVRHAAAQDQDAGAPAVSRPASVFGAMG